MDATPALITSKTVDAEYTKLCSQIGETYCRRAELAQQLAALDEQLTAYQSQRTQLVAQFQALVHNEKVPAPAPEKNVTPISHGK